MGVPMKSRSLLAFGAILLAWPLGETATREEAIHSVAVSCIETEGTQRSEKDLPEFELGTVIDGTTKDGVEWNQQNYHSADGVFLVVRREYYSTPSKAKSAFDVLLKTFKKDEIRLRLPKEKYGRTHERALVRIANKDKITWKLLTLDGDCLRVIMSDSVSHLALLEVRF